MLYPTNYFAINIASLSQFDLKTEFPFTPFLESSSETSVLKFWI